MEMCVRVFPTQQLYVGVFPTQQVGPHATGIPSTEAVLHRRPVPAGPSGGGGHSPVRLYSPVGRQSPIFLTEKRRKMRDYHPTGLYATLTQEPPRVGGGGGGCC